jgi:hypothetical protein
MITFRSIFDKLTEELSPEKGHMGTSNDIDIYDKIISSDAHRHTEKFIEYLKNSGAEWNQLKNGTQDILRSITKGAPEAYYWLWKNYPARTRLKAIASQGSYVLYGGVGVYGSALNLLIDEGAGQIIGMILSKPVPEFKPYFNNIPQQVRLSQVVPELRGGGDGKVMYSLFLQAHGSIVSDHTLYEGSFAMWDTQIRQSAKYSGVFIESVEGLDVPLINKNDSVYDLPIINRLLTRFFASNTIAPWVIGFSKKLSTVNQKEAAYVSVTTSKYTPEEFYEVLDAIVDTDDATTIVLGLSGQLRGRAKGKLGPEVNKFLRLVPSWSGELWSSPGSYKKAKHIIILFYQTGSDTITAIYDIDLSTEEPQIRIL